MKKFIFGLAALLSFALMLSSCRKDPASDFLGTYHFKMSGKFAALSSAGDTTDFILSSQSGTMTVVHGQNGNYFVHMSVWLGGDVMSFNATLEDNYLYLDSHTVVVSIKQDGGNSATSLFSSSSKNVSLSLSGVGGRYDSTLTFKMDCSGSFVYGDESETYEVVPQSSDIVCFATDL